MPKKLFKSASDGLAVLLLTALFFIFHAAVLFGSKVYLNLWIFKDHPPFEDLFPKTYNFLNQSSDFITQLFANKYMIAQAVREGFWPLWNPYVLSGFPIYANGSSAVFSPLHLLLFYFNPFEAYTTQLLMMCLIGGGALYVLLRRIYAFGVFPSLCAVLVYLFCPYVTANLDVDMVLGFLWAFPVLMIILEVCFKQKKRVHFIVLGLFLGIVGLFSHMHVLLNVLLLTAIFVSLKLWQAGSKERIRVLSYSMLSILFFIGLSFIQLAPFLS